MIKRISTFLGPTFSRKLQLGSLLLLLPISAWAQSAHYSVPAASVEEQFSASDQTLSGAADDVLIAATQANGGPSPAPSANADSAAGAQLRRFAQQYWDGQQKDVRRAVQRVNQLRPILDPILRQEGVPIDVAALVLVESGGRATALSPKGALGLWQLMPETARRYGLVVSPAEDERVNVVKSTHAAARYLHDLYGQFADWDLAFAAYNAGEGAIQRAIIQGGAHDFARLRRISHMPLETRDYVPAVLAAVQLLGGTLQSQPAQRSANASTIYAQISN